MKILGFQLWIKEAIFFIFLLAITAKLIFSFVEHQFFILNFRTFHYNLEKQDFCSLTFKKENQRFSLPQTEIFHLLEKTLLKPYHPLIGKLTSIPLSIRRVVLFQDHLVVDFNRHFFKLNLFEEKKTIESLLLGLVANFSRVKKVTFLVEGRGIELLHMDGYDYRFPIEIPRSNYLREIAGISPC